MRQQLSGFLAAANAVDLAPLAARIDGFKLREVIMRTLVDDYERRLRQDARAFLRGEREAP